MIVLWHFKIHELETDRDFLRQLDIDSIQFVAITQGLERVLKDINESNIEQKENRI